MKGSVQYSLTNGYIMSCMVCKRIYFSRYRNGERKCVGCGDVQCQQETSPYGVTG